MIQRWGYFRWSGQKGLSDQVLCNLREDTGQTRRVGGKHWKQEKSMWRVRGGVEEWCVSSGVSEGQCAGIAVGKDGSCIR